MTMPTDTPAGDALTAPGIALRTLLRETKGPALRKLIGPDLLNTIHEFDPELVSENQLGELACNLIQPSEALHDTEMRERIIRILPLPKARELGNKLGVNDGRTLYDDLCKKASDSSALPDLCSFFGVVRDVRAPAATASDVTQASAGYALFAHQRKAAERVMQALSDEPRKVVLHMPTGSGKTRTAMHVVASHLRSHESTVVCWLAHSAELLDQAADEFQSAWQYLGNRNVSLVRFWGQRGPDVLDMQDGLLVAGLGKMNALNNRDLAALPKLADCVSLTVIDEAHQAIAPTYSDVITALYSKRPGNALLGLTATPGRSWSDMIEDQELSDYFERCKVTLKVKGYDDPVSFLIDQGYLARPIFRTLDSDADFPISKRDSNAISSGSDVPTQVLKSLGADTRRTVKTLSVIEDLVSRHRRIIVFAPSVENARALTAILSLRDHETFSVTGESDSLERERVIRRFRSRHRDSMILINYGVLTTGFDAPATSAAVIARPTKSLVLYSQMVGRATRGVKAGGNDEAEIVTIVDLNLPGFNNMADAFNNWEDVWNEPDQRK